MTPEYKPGSPEEMGSRITALLLGELPEAAAAEVRAAVKRDPEFARLCQRLKATIELVRQAAAPAEPTSAQAAPLQLSDARRQQVLQRFKTIAPREFLTGGLKGLADYLSSNSTTIKNQIQDIIDKIVRFITIVRTGQIPGAMTTGASANLAAQAEEGLNIPIQKVVETGGLDKIAQKIHQIAVDMARFVDKLSPMLKSFVEINKETVESIAKSLERNN